ncbi:MAG TPA: sortase [Gaiellaceae bacterium]|nr:sortase [Gaiellaceae bacterium]
MTLKRSVRIAGTGLIVAGLLMLAWVVVVWRWQDPFTALYTHWKQHQLAHSYEHRFAAYAPRPVTRSESVAAKMDAIKREARRYRLDSHRGQAIGRIRVPRLGLKMILVNGTDDSTLRKGPGRDLRTYMPGEGQLVYIAGHRTTYLAPFAHIDKIRMGDSVTLELPYGTFRYTVFRRRIVGADDLAVLHSHGREVVVLQACHPRFFASHRYLVYARLAEVQPRGARAFRAPVTVLAAAPLAAAQG